MNFFKYLLGAQQQEAEQEAHGTHANAAATQPSDTNASTTDDTAAAAGLDDFADVPELVQRETKPPARSSNDLTTTTKDGKRRGVSFNPTREELAYNVDAPAEATTEGHAIVNAAGINIDEVKRPCLELSASDCKKIKDKRNSKPDHDSLTLPGNRSFRNLKNYIASDYSPLDYLPNPRGLRFVFDSEGFDIVENPGLTVFASPEDDPIIKNAMGRYLYVTNPTGGMNALEEFYKKYIRGNWTGFERRNEDDLKKIVALVAALGGGSTGAVEAHESETAGTQDNVDPMARVFERGFERMATVQDDIRRDAQSNTQMFADQLDKQRQDNKEGREALMTMFHAHRKDSKRNNRTLERALKRSQSAPRGRLQSDDLSIHSSPSSTASTPSSHGSPSPIQQPRVRARASRKALKRSQSAPRGRLQSDDLSIQSSPWSTASTPSSHGSPSPIQQPRVRARAPPATERKARAGSSKVGTPGTKKMQTRQAVTERKAPKPLGTTEEVTLFDSPEPKSTVTKKKKATAPKNRRRPLPPVGVKVRTNSGMTGIVHESLNPNAKSRIPVLLDGVNSVVVFNIDDLKWRLDSD